MSSIPRAEVALLVLIAAGLIFGLWTWSKLSIDRVSQNSGETKNRTLACSDIEIDYIDFKQAENGTAVFLESNRDVDALYLFSDGDGSNATLRNLSANTIRSVNTSFRRPESIYGRIPGCRQRFG